MMGVKGGTQTWSNAQQQTSMKSDNTQTISATDREKLFQGADLGETLNKVADPNFIAQAKELKSHGNNQLGKDSFMTLLLTQMKNQDPTNPLKSHEMAAQLAQFTSLEKLTNIDSSIAGLRKDTEPQNNFQALAFIGKTITTDNSKVDRTSPTEQHQMYFNLPGDAPVVRAQVKDGAGTLIRTIEVKGMKAGKNELNWNGLTDEGQSAGTGPYTIAIEAVGSNGRRLHVETKTEGVITGVNFTPQGPQLLVGKQVVSMAEVKSITDSNVQQPDMMTPKMPNLMAVPGAAANPAQGPNKAEVKPETKANADKAAKMGKGNLNDAAMAQGLINTLNKQGAKAGMG